MKPGTNPLRPRIPGTDPILRGVKTARHRGTMGGHIGSAGQRQGVKK